jgi:molybdopterin adenylyltransferase
MPGGRIDTDRAFTPLGVAVLTLSDSRDASSDTSGDLLVERGTGLTARDVTPEAFRALFSTMQSRACAGIAGNTVIYVLPGSTGACRDGWDKLISLQIDSRHQPCSILEALPRFKKP